MDTPPIMFVWEGDCFKPVGPHWARLCDKYFTIGEKYELVEKQERSHATHAHYFAAVHDAWLNLPEALAVEYPNPEKLRKHALIKAGYADSQTHVCSSKAEAARLAAFIRPMDEFSVVATSACTVTRYTAKSQSMRAMGKEDFQRSKEAVLEVLAAMVGTSRAALEGNQAA